MCCLKEIVTASLDAGADQLDFEKAICSGSRSANAPLASVPPSVVSDASPAVEITLAVADASYVRSTPGTNGPNVAEPTVKPSVAGTVALTSPEVACPIEIG